MKRRVGTLTDSVGIKAKVRRPAKSNEQKVSSELKPTNHHGSTDITFDE